MEVSNPILDPAGMHAGRAVWVALGALVVTVLAVFLYRHGPHGFALYPGCLFRKFTGLDCPGCGMTRATYAAMHGRIGEAFRFNPVGMVIFPLAVLGISIELIGWIRGRPRSLQVGAKGAWGLAFLVIAFWFLRNIPFYPFTLLAPP